MIEKAKQYLIGDEVISGMARRLRDGFTKEEFPEIYKNTPKQNAADYYIFISETRFEQRNQLREYSEMSFLMNVNFIHPKKMDKEDEWSRQVAFRGCEYLRTILVQGIPVKAQDVKWVVVGNFVCITCRYTFRVKYDDQRENILMQNVDSSTRMK